MSQMSFSDFKYAGKRKPTAGTEPIAGKRPAQAKRRRIASPLRCLSTQSRLRLISQPQGSITQGTQQIEAVTEQQADGKADL